MSLNNKTPIVISRKEFGLIRLHLNCATKELDKFIANNAADLNAITPFEIRHSTETMADAVEVQEKDNVMSNYFIISIGDDAPYHVQTFNDAFKEKFISIIEQFGYDFKFRNRERDINNHSIELNNSVRYPFLKIYADIKDNCINIKIDVKQVFNCDKHGKIATKILAFLEKYLKPIAIKVNNAVVGFFKKIINKIKKIDTTDNKEDGSNG